MSITAKSKTCAEGFLAQSRKEIAKVIAKALSACGSEREDIAKIMSGILNRKITKHMLDAYASEARDTHIPALDVAIAFDLATGQTALSGYFVSKFAGRIVLSKDIPLLEVARIQREKVSLNQREKKAMLAAGIVDRDALDTEVRLEMLEADVMAYQLILGWLMANQPGDDSINFLRDQAFEFEDGEGGKEKYGQEVSTLDGVRELAIDWRKKNQK